MTTTPLRLAAVACTAALALSACGADSGADDGTVQIVASTNVYGSIAQAIAGDDAEVTSIITSANQDPHEYEASAQDRLKIDRADLVIANGGGYDPFIDTLLDGARHEPTVIDAVDVSGLAPDDHDDKSHDDGDHGHVEGFNEHVWYDLHAMEKVAEKIADDLADLDPDHASAYADNLAAFTKQLEGVEQSAAQLKTTAEGQGAAITEPVPLYLLTEVGLVNRTPEAFSEAVEEGTDVPPRALKETLDLFADDDIAVLAYNSQTEDATTERVKSAAEAAGVPVVDFTETLPKGTTYVQWQQDNIDALADSLGGQ